jgi:hypothetical protein
MSPADPFEPGFPAISARMTQEEMTQMDTARIVHEINAEITRLTSARNILTGSNSTSHARTAHAKGVAKKMRTNRLSPVGQRNSNER